MKKFTAGLLALVMCIMLFTGCGQTPPKATTAGQESQVPTTEERGEHMLSGKRVLFIGNSFTYYGMCVMEKARGVLDQESRSNDQGYFYQLCKANGAEVAVTNWTFGGHHLHDIFDICAADRGCDGVDHKAYLTDRSFDYVVIQDGRRTAGKREHEFLDQIDAVMSIFRQANPRCSSFFWCPTRSTEMTMSGVRR